VPQSAQVKQVAAALSNAVDITRLPAQTADIARAADATPVATTSCSTSSCPSVAAVAVVAVAVIAVLGQGIGVKASQRQCSSTVSL
jgi:hypothetical protein